MTTPASTPRNTQSTESPVAVESTTVIDSTADVASTTSVAVAPTTMTVLPAEEEPRPLDPDLEREYAGLSTAGRACDPGPSADAGVDASVAGIRGEKWSNT